MSIKSTSSEPSKSSNDLERLIEEQKEKIESLKKQLAASQERVRAKSRKLRNYQLQNIDYHNIEFKSMVNRERRLNGPEKTDAYIWAEYVSTRFTTYLGNMGVEPERLLDDIKARSVEKTGEPTPLTIGELVQEENWDNINEYDWIFIDPYTGLSYKVTFDYYTNSYTMEERNG